MKGKNRFPKSKRDLNFLSIHKRKKEGPTEERRKHPAKGGAKKRTLTAVKPAGRVEKDGRGRMRKPGGLK